MHSLARRLTALTALTLGLAAFAHGRYVASISKANPASPSLTVLNEDLQVIGSVGVPSGAKQVLISDDGAKLIVISENAQSPVSFIGFAGSALTQVRTTSLGSGTPVVARLTADGSHLLVATRNPSLVYMVQVASEQVVNAPIAVPGEPVDAELTNDGQYLLVLNTPNLLTPIQLSTWQALSSVAVDRPSGDNKMALSVAPFGSVFVTASGVLAEHRGLPPFDELARTALTSGLFNHPGKLQFMQPGGTRAFAANQVQLGSSVGVFDFALRGPATPAGSYVAGVPVIGTTGSPFGTTPELVEPLLATRDLRAVGLAPAVKQVFEFSYVVGGGLNVNDMRVGQAPLTEIESIACSTEFPNARYLFYVKTGGTLYRFPLSGVGSIPTKDIQTGTLHWVSAPSTGTPGNMYGYGGGKTGVAASSTIRYYVRAFDAGGVPLKGRAVAFRAVTQGAQVLQNSVTTNREGWAYVDVIAPSAAGDFTVEATLGNLAPIQFTSTVTASGGGGGGGGGGHPISRG